MQLSIEIHGDRYFLEDSSGLHGDYQKKGSQLFIPWRASSVQVQAAKECVLGFRG